MKHALSLSCVATVILSATSLIAQDAARYTIKGYRLGMRVADVQALQAPFKQKLKPCTKPDVHGIARCQATYSNGLEPWKPIKRETIANVEFVSMEFHFIDGRLYSFSATFPVDRFDDMSNALSAKWGRPNSSTLEILYLPGCLECRFRFPSRRNSWSDGASSMILEECGVVNLVDAARLQVDDLRLTQEVQRRQPARKPDL